MNNTLKISMLLVLLTACLSFTPPKDLKTRTVLTIQNKAVSPRFSTDNRGQVVLSWVEKLNDDNAQLFYATSTDAGKSFGPKIQVRSAPATISTHGEGMPKIAIKSDGTVLALFEVSKPTADAPRASDLLFTESKDNGKTWTECKTVHQDQTPGKGHSFADMSRLPNGQIGFVWLDEKMPGFEGRSVKFTQTLPNGGFGSEILIDSNACQCCRTSLLAGPDGRLHIAWRDMIPGDKTAKEPDSRDMSYVVSADGGATFSRPVVLNNDNWKINACPHSGIQMVANGPTVWATWYSGTTTEPGLRLTSIGPKIETTVLGSNAMKHPQIAVLADGSLMLVWDELVGEGMTAYRKIGLRRQRADEPKPNAQVVTYYLTPPGQMSSSPVVMPVGSQILVAYEVEKGINVVELPDGVGL